MFYLIISITLLAAMSPGPDFFIVMKNALRSRLSGYATSLGVATAILVHVAYCIAGVGIIISQSILLFQVIKILGAFYLLYLSYQLLKAKKQEKELEIEKGKTYGFFKSFQEGFITNVMNPKATLFFLSVFTQVISPETIISTQIFYGIAMAITALFWFVFLSSVVNQKYIRKNIQKGEFYIHKIMGGILGILGIKILFSSK